MHGYYFMRLSDLLMPSDHSWLDYVDVSTMCSPDASVRSPVTAGPLQFSVELDFRGFSRRWLAWLRDV